MDLLKLFTREEPVAGIEISDSCVRLAFLSLKKITVTPPKGASGKKAKEEKKEAVEIKTLAEKELPAGAVVGGEVKDKVALKEALKSLVKEAKPPVKYAVVSLPPDRVYSKFYSFPKTVGEEKLKDAMQTIANFQLPLKQGSFYSDWEKGREQEGHAVFLAALAKPIIDEYLDVLKQAGVSPVAVEFHPLSAARAAEAPVDTAVLSFIFYGGGALAFVAQNKIIRFARFLPTEFFSKKEALAEEARKIIDFYEAEAKKSVSEIVLIGGGKEKIGAKLPLGVSVPKIIEPFASHEAVKKDAGKWLAALGAARRGLLPRADDTLVSLMPVGTEEAYENQRAIAFSEFISSALIGISLFFVVVFFAGWLLMASLSRNFNSRISALNSLPLPSDAAAIESRANDFNNLIGKTGAILSGLPAWSAFLEDLKTRVGSGVNITSLALPSTQEQLTVNGIARNRNQLNAFKKSLEESPYLTEVVMPLTNLAQRENIPFTISFRLKEPSIIQIYK